MRRCLCLLSSIFSSICSRLVVSDTSGERLETRRGLLRRCLSATSFTDVYLNVFWCGSAFVFYFYLHGENVIITHKQSLSLSTATKVVVVAVIARTMVKHVERESEIVWQ